MVSRLPAGATYVEEFGKLLADPTEPETLEGEWQELRSHLEQQDALSPEQWRTFRPFFRAGVGGCEWWWIVHALLLEAGEDELTAAERADIAARERTFREEILPKIRRFLAELETEFGEPVTGLPADHADTGG